MSAQSSIEKNKRSSRKDQSNKFNSTNSEYDSNFNNNKYLKIPRIQNRRGNMALEDSSNYSNNKNESQSKERNSKFKKKKSNNIINIVNNVNGHNDKNNNIGLKVNINRYDIKCYIPSKKKNNDKNISGGANLNFSNDSSKSSQEIIINNSIRNSDYRNNNGDENKNNGINVDIINFSRKGTKKIADNNKQIYPGKTNANDEDVAIERKLRRQILHKIKSMNNLYRTDMLYNRPKLDGESFASNDAENKPQARFKKFMSKEIKYNTCKQDRKGRLDKIDFEDYFNEEGSNRSHGNHKHKDSSWNRDNNNYYLNSQNSNSVSTKKISNANTSAERFEKNFNNNNNSRNLNQILTEGSDSYMGNRDRKNSGNNNNSNLLSDNSKDDLRNKSSKDAFGNLKKNKRGIGEDYSLNEIKNKRKKRIRKKGINENGEEYSFSIEVTDSQYDSEDDLGFIIFCLIIYLC